MSSSFSCCGVVVLVFFLNIFPPELENSSSRNSTSAFSFLFSSAR